MHAVGAAGKAEALAAGPVLPQVILVEHFAGARGEGRRGVGLAFESGGCGLVWRWGGEGEVRVAGAARKGEKQGKRQKAKGKRQKCSGRRLWRTKGVI